MKLSRCEAASKDIEQMWCRELNRFKCTINPNSQVQIPGFSVIGKMQEVDERRRRKLRIPLRRV
jgi:hypothetical protein